MVALGWIEIRADVECKLQQMFLLASSCLLVRRRLGREDERFEFVPERLPVEGQILARLQIVLFPTSHRKPTKNKL